MQNISGVIGLSILQNKKNKIFIFYDDHQNIKYCGDKFYISDLFSDLLKNEKINKDICLLLEEPFYNNLSKIKVLWSESGHLHNFRKFYTQIINRCTKDNICKGYPVDVRLALTEFSIEEMMDSNNTSSKYTNINIKNYFNPILYLFDIHKTLLKKNSIIEFLKKIFINFSNTQFYKELHKRIIIFYEKFIKENENILLYQYIETLSQENFIFKYIKGYPFINENNIYFFDEIDKILSGIMEFFTFIMILILPQKFKFFYAGYYHSNNIKYILINYYGYELVSEYGITEDIEIINSSKINNCIAVEKKYLDL
jgi:hypothetical protein